MQTPPGFATLTPYLFVTGAARFIAFLAEAFGAEEIGRSTLPDGRIAHAQLRLGNAMLMASEAVERYPAMPGSFYLYVTDVDATMARALAAGARLELEVADMPYGDRQGGVRDPFGNLWWISQRLVDAPYYPGSSGTE
jgi:PhnB protein